MFWLSMLYTVTSCKWIQSYLYMEEDSHSYHLADYYFLGLKIDVAGTLVSLLWSLARDLKKVNMFIISLLS